MPPQRTTLLGSTMRNYFDAISRPFSTCLQRKSFPPYEGKRIFTTKTRTSSPAAPELITNLEENRNDFLCDVDWWKKTIIYHIYPRSFCDGNGDGFGDLRGIISKLDYFTYLKINCIWLSPIYASPMRDCGYDISDFKAIDPVFGTLEDFDELIEGLHQRGIKLIMDFVPNHASSDHPWFKQSCLSKDNPYADYFVWSDGKRDENGVPRPPNNWLSVFGGSMWEWCETRQQFYLHQYLTEMPDLNFRNPQVRKEIEDALAFWLERGVDGFRIDSAKHLVEAEDLYQDEEPSNRTDVPPGHYDSLRHRLTIDQPETHEVMKSWRRLFDAYYERDGFYRFMVAEIYEDVDTTLEEVMEHYHNGNDAPFNFRLVSRFRPETGGWGLRNIIEEWFEAMPPGKWPIWALGNHDNPRIADKFGPDFANALNFLLLLLPGTPVTYYGEELAMRGRNVSFEDTQDIYCKRFGPDLYHHYCRDRARGPMWWDSSENAGFCPPGVKPWLPVHEDFANMNVQVQRFWKPESSLQMYREVASLRLQPEFQANTFKSGYTTKHIYTIIRRRAPEDIAEDGDPGFRFDVVVNIGDEAEVIDTPATKLFSHDGDDFLDVENGRQTPKIILNTNNMRPDQQKAIAGFPFEPITIYPSQAFVIRSRPVEKR